MSDRLAEWRRYLRECERAGHTPLSIRVWLIHSGYEPQHVDTIIRDYLRHEQRRAVAPLLIALVMLGGIGSWLFIGFPAGPGPTGFVTAGAGTVGIASNPVVTVDFSRTTASVPSHFYGFFGSFWGGNATKVDCNNNGGLDCVSDYTAHRTAMLGSGANYLRRDMNLDNVVAPDGVTFYKHTWSNGGNIDNARSQVAWAKEHGFTILFEADFMPSWLANNASNCASWFPTCEPSNYTMWGQIVTNFLNTTGCADNPSVCEVEVWNEPYLGQFWLSDGTCQQRTDAYIRMYNATYQAIKAKYPSIKVGGPSGYYGYTCGASLTNAWLGNFTQAQSDFVSIHDYGDSGLSADLAQSVSTIIAHGHNNSIKLTEYNAIDPNVLVNRSDLNYLYVVDTMQNMLNSFPSVSTLVIYQWAEDNPWSDGVPWYNEWPRRFVMFAEPQFENTTYAPYNASRDMGTYHPAGSTVVSSTGTSTFFVLATVNGSNHTVTIGNRGSGTQSVDVHLSGINASSLVNLQTASTSVVSGNSATITLAPYAVQHYTIVPSTPPANQPPVVNAPFIISADGTNSTNAPLNCSASATDPDGGMLNLTVEWRRNGTAASTVTTSVASGATGLVTLAANQLTPLDVWTCAAHVSDGVATSAWNASTSSVTIRVPGHTSPVLTSFAAVSPAPSNGQLANWSGGATDTTPLSYSNASTNASGTWISLASQAASGATTIATTISATTTAPKGASICAQWSVTNTDGYSNTSEISCMTVANAPPVPVTVSLSAEPSVIEPTDVRCEITATDADNDPLTADITWLHDGIASSTTSSVALVAGVVDATLATPAPGSWTCQANVSDGSVSSSAVNSSPVTILGPDTLAPTVTALTPADNASLPLSAAAFSWRVIDDRSSSTRCVLVVDGVVAANATANNDTVKNVTISGLTQASHTWYARCADSANNTGASVTRQVSLTKPQHTTPASSGGGGGGGGGAGRLSASGSATAVPTAPTPVTATSSSSSSSASTSPTSTSASEGNSLSKGDEQHTAEQSATSQALGSGTGVAPAAESLSTTPEQSEPSVNTSLSSHTLQIARWTMLLAVIGLIGVATWQWHAREQALEEYDAIVRLEQQTLTPAST